MFSFIGLIILIVESIYYLSSSNQSVFSRSGLLVVTIIIFQLICWLAHWGYELTNDKSHELSMEYFNNGENKTLLKEGAKKLFTPLEENYYEFYFPIESIILDFISIFIALFAINKTGSYKVYLITLICTIGLFAFNLLASYRTAYLIHKELDMKVKRVYKRKV